VPLGCGSQHTINTFATQQHTLATHQQHLDAVSSLLQQAPQQKGARELKISQLQGLAVQIPRHVQVPIFDLLPRREMQAS
jgi:hypothetical protein